MVNFQYMDWNANLLAVYHDEHEMATGGSLNNRISLDSYTVLSSKVSYRLTQDFEGFVQFKNLLDKGYLGPAVSTGLVEGIPNRGREALVGLSWNY